jgi:signal transduction histidine kinase
VPRAEPLDLDEVALDEVSRIRQRVSVGFDTSQVSAAPVMGNRDDLARLMRNLVENAATHALSQVTVRVSSTSTFARLTICDDGPGIPEDQRDRVFERFARVEQARARGTPEAHGGTGLGLSIARVIAERHLGSIRIEPPADTAEGTCLVVELPLAPSQMQEVVQERGTNSA